MEECANTHRSRSMGDSGYAGVPVSIRGSNGMSKRHWFTLSEYITERRSSRSATISGSLNTTICEPMTLRCKIFVSEIHQRQTIHNPRQPRAIPEGSSLTMFLGHLRKSLPDRIRGEIEHVAYNWETFWARWVRGACRSPFLSCRSKNYRGHGNSQGWAGELLQD